LIGDGLKCSPKKESYIDLMSLYRSMLRGNEGRERKGKREGDGNVMTYHLPG
jgi:hypothetical protein